MRVRGAVPRCGERGAQRRQHQRLAGVATRRRIVLDGSTDYVTYSLTGREFNSDEISIVIEFTPDFAANDGLSHYLWNSAADDLFFKNGAGSLVLWFNGASIATIALGVYSAYWRQGGRNTLAVSGSSGDTSVWLNGNAILSNDASAWTPSGTSSLIVGTNTAKSLFFDGTIHSLLIFHGLLTQAEAQAYSDNSMYSYRNRAVLDLPMLMGDHDPSNVRALDRSGNGNHATLGDGVTPTTYPTKLATRGYSFDGGDYMQSSALGLSTLSTLTMWTVVKVSTLGQSMGIVCYEDPALGNVGGLLFHVSSGAFQFYCGDTGGNQAANFSSAGYLNRTAILVGVYDGANTILYLDGVQGTNAVGPTAPANAATGIVAVGSRGNGSTARLLNGSEVLGAGLIPFGLTPIQVQDLTLRIRRELGKVA